MARVTVEDCLDHVQNRFALVLLVAKRSKQLLKGADLTLHRTNNKYIVNSLREVAAGHVTFKMDEASGTPEEQIERDINR